ncbi:hypothetical protein [Streptomyces macrosporus]|uniref:Integral membrane protein n=1 Tax=Streptomyces macrosporus TaxID=44032 RepID=A0ABP5XHB7_9ACTN
MYGPAATPPPAPSRPGPGVGGMVMRLFFASFPVWSLGLLAWVPSLRFAILRRRPVDWLVFGVAVALTAVYVVLLATVPTSDDAPESMGPFWAGLYILLLIAGSVVHAVLGDRFLRDPAAYRAARPAPYPTPHPTAHPAPPVAPHAADIANAPTAYGYPRPAAPVPPAPVPPAAPVPPPPGPRTPPPAGPQSPRMRQVASELDELDALLRGRDGRENR